MGQKTPDICVVQLSSDRPSKSWYKSTILAKMPGIPSPSWQNLKISFLRSICLRTRNSRISATISSQMVSECSAGAAVNTCKGVFYQHFILSINEINSMKTLYNACFPITEDSNLHCCYTPKTARC